MLAHHHDIGAMPFEVVDRFLKMRPRDNGERGVDSARLLHHLAALERVGSGDEKAARGAKICRTQHLRIGAVTGKRGDAPLAQFPHFIPILLDDEERHFAFGEESADDLANTAVTDQDHVILEPGARDLVTESVVGIIGLNRRATLSLVTRKQPVESREQERIEGGGRFSR